tara:strand:- start:125 stop:889 length:765 start_codon:yes stop_codon:yes gene_type:complete
MMNLRLARPEVLIDLNQIEQLDYINDEGGVIEVGAITRLRSLETDEQVSFFIPLLQEAVGLVAHAAVRARGTVGGNIAHADPSAEIPTALVALEANIVASSASGERDIPAKDFFLGAFFTSLEEREIVTSVKIPKSIGQTGSAFVEFAPRHGDFAIVGVAAIISIDDSGKCTSVRIVLSGVDGRPLDVSSAAEPLIGNQEISQELFEAVGQSIFERVDPGSDIHASAEFRRELCQMLSVDALNKAWERLGGSNG